MATLSHAQSRRMYSWWWDSHISPKNSKWLQENLTDMDAKVKQMIKLIEEDADSFARRAEMYYKKRPELMKMVEEFYRAYRALAERYDHATGVIRQAHRTMIEVFPNQDPLVSGDDSPVSSAASEGDPHTPEMPPLIRAMFDPDELHKDSLGLSSSNFRKSNGSTEGRVKKGLNFNDAADIEQQSVRNGENHNIKARFLSESERGGKSDREITILKEALAKLEAEKVAGLLQYQRSLEKLSDLETEVVRAQEDSIGLNERASKAEAEVLILKADLTKSEAEREATLLQYQQCLDKISNLEKSITFAQENVGELNELANRAETEAQAVKHDLSMVEAEKEAVLVQNNQLLIKVSDLEKKLLQAEEDARRINEQADNAESEVETLKQALAKLTEEKETAALQYQQCLETISILERQISCAQEEAQRLNKEIGDSVSKIKGAEERCLQLETSNQSLQAELESLVHKMGTQDQELTQKQQEVGTLWTCVKEERSRFVEVESAFQALQHLHSQSQEELSSMAAELQQRVQVLNELEMQNNGLQDELQKAKEENRSLNEHNFSSAMSIKNMQDELAILKEAREKLEEEVELRVDQRNALQQEIYCLKEEINDLNKKHQAVLEQMDSVGLNSECFGSAVKELQDENSELHEVCHRERSEKIAFFEKLEIMEKLLEKNAVLENSLSDLSAELEATREKVKELEQSCQFYLGEKSVLVAEKATVFSQLQITTENLGKLTEKNAFLENSLFDANVELEGFREKMKSLEKSFQLLDTEKSLLISEKESLVSQIQISQQKLEDLEKRYTELEEKYTGLEKEKESTLCKVEELLVSLDVEKKLTQLSATRLADLESQLFLLQEESQGRKKALEEELDEAVNAQIEIFILQKCVKDVENENVSLLVQCEKLLDTSELSKKLISELEHEKLEQQVEVKSFCDRINKMRIWMYQVLKALDIDSYHGCDDIIEQDRTHMDQILGKIEDKISSLSKTLDENQQLILENLVLSTLLGQLRLDAANLETDKNTHYQELITRTRELLALQNENQSLEEENSSICSQAISLSFLSLILKNTVKEKSAELKEFGENLDEIHGVNGIMEEKLKIIRGDLEMAGVENHHLKESLDKSDNELKTVRYVCDQLSIDVASGKEMLHQKEVELLEAEKKLELLQNEQMELQNLMEDLQRKFDEVKVIKEDQERQIHKLSEENDVLSKEGECLRGMTQTLEAKLLTLEEEYEEIKVREKTLRSQSENWRNEAELWETEGTLFFSELQISAIHGALFAEKIHELSEACQSLESKSNSNSMEIELVKERVGTLEEKNGELEAQMAACIPAINSLERSIASLENYALQCSEVDKPENEKDDKLESHLQAESCGELNENINAKVPEGFPIFQGLETRIKAIEKALIEMKRLATQEKLNNNREIEPDTGDDPKLRKLAHEISEAGSEILTKDIMLDQISECSPYGKSRTETVEADDQMLELWETTDQNGSIDLKVGKAQKMVTEPNSYHRVKAVEKEKSRNPASEISVDKLEISKRFAEPRQEGNKKNILERLASDAQKLTNLQITLQDLKRKVEITEKNKKGKGIEYGTVKEQLEESEEAILKLFDINKKLRNSAQEKALSSEEKYDADSEESGSVRRRRLSEQARKGSEKIGRLQLEVQKLQFLLLKLDHGKENKGKTRITERKTRVLLRDYLYGGIIRPSHKRKKASFCACVQPPTKGD